MLPHRECLKYEFMQQIGRGGYADVKMARDVTTNRAIAIKQLRDLDLKALQRELMILRMLRRGPNIINALVS